MVYKKASLSVEKDKIEFNSSSSQYHLPKYDSTNTYVLLDYNAYYEQNGERQDKAI